MNRSLSCFISGDERDGDEVVTMHGGGGGGGGYEWPRSVPETFTCTVFCCMYYRCIFADDTGNIIFYDIIIIYGNATNIIS